MPRHEAYGQRLCNFSLTCSDMFNKLLNLIPYGMLIRGMIFGFLMVALSLYVKFS